MKQPKCIKLFLENTHEGERNHNFFKAINHLRHFNINENVETIYQTALNLNKIMKSPLPENEVLNVVKHVTKTKYKSSCNNFNKQCQRCNIGTRKKPYKQYKPNYWKTIRKDNTIVRTLTNGAKLYPWDVVDTEKLNNEQKFLVMELREEKGMNPIIDTVLKLRGVKIGDEALEEWNEYRNK